MNIKRNSPRPTTPFACLLPLSGYVASVRAALSRATPDGCQAFLVGSVAFVFAPRGVGSGYKTHKRLGAELKGTHILRCYFSLAERVPQGAGCFDRFGLGFDTNSGRLDFRRIKPATRHDTRGAGWVAIGSWKGSGGELVAIVFFVCVGARARAWVYDGNHCRHANERGAPDCTHTTPVLFSAPPLYDRTPRSIQPVLFAGITTTSTTRYVKGCNPSH